MAKITYVWEGETVDTARLQIDNETIDSTNFASIVDSNIHAIQWNGTSGEIEYKDDTPNKEITDISSYDFEAKFATEKQAIADAEAKVETDRISAMTYAEKREAEYPAIGDQLDDIYHNGIDSWKSTIKAIKDKYPKP
tara:strand:+ start:905 stop:1318 length:414 start_codon:yes stop_codon:yes gene_type:complete